MSTIHATDFKNFMERKLQKQTFNRQPIQYRLRKELNLKKSYVDNMSTTSQINRKLVLTDMSNNNFQNANPTRKSVNQRFQFKYY